MQSRRLAYKVYINSASTAIMLFIPRKSFDAIVNVSQNSVKRRDKSRVNCLAD